MYNRWVPDNWITNTNRYDLWNTWLNILNNLKKQPDLSVIIQRQNFNFNLFFLIMLLLRACDIGCGKYGISGVINIYILHTVGYKEQCYRMSMTKSSSSVNGNHIKRGDNLYQALPMLMATISKGETSISGSSKLMATISKGETIYIRLFQC